MKNHYGTSKGLHLNYALMAEYIEENSKILDLGCGHGYLLKLLKDEKNVKGNGIEISQENVIVCLQKGLSVIQGDIDDGLKQFPDKSYDYVVLDQTLQTTQNPYYVIQEMLRVGKKCIISFPNFAYWRVRFSLFFLGRMPKSKVLPFEWYNTPNIHLLTVKDFFAFADKENIKIIDKIYTTRAKKRNKLHFTTFANFYAEEAVFVISKD